MNKVILLSGSPNENGNTVQVLKECARVIEENGLEAEVISLAGMELKDAMNFQGGYNDGLDEIIEIPTHYNYIVTPVNTYAREDILSSKGKIDYTKYHPVLFEMPMARYLRTGDAIGDCWRIGKNMKEILTENKDNQNKGGSVFAVPEEKTVYAIITVKIKDREKFMEYVKGHIPSVLQYGGKFRFEGIAVEDIENSAFAGDRSDLVVIQEWPAKENFYEWWNSEEYKPWKEMRPQGADVTVTLTEQRGNNI